MPASNFNDSIRIVTFKGSRSTTSVSPYANFGALASGQTFCFASVFFTSHWRRLFDLDIVRSAHRVASRASQFNESPGRDGLGVARDVVSFLKEGSPTPPRHVTRGTKAKITTRPTCVSPAVDHTVQAVSRSIRLGATYHKGWYTCKGQDEPVEAKKCSRHTPCAVAFLYRCWTAHGVCLLHWAGGREALDTKCSASPRRRNDKTMSKRVLTRMALPVAW